ncbi:MAG: aquaporin family protein [Acidobacteria bacterium]|nr:aquaporin family protein [Acidobacteriota bacterium]
MKLWRLPAHWPEYAAEAVNLGVFMVSACTFGVLLWHPASLFKALPDGVARRGAMGVLMGLTLLAIVYSRFGKRSGAHMNPAVTLTYLLLGRVERMDAAFYIACQFAGGVAGVALAGFVIGGPLADPAVHFVVTRPGGGGVGWAFVAETVISFAMMLTVLTVSNHPRLARRTPLFAAALVALYITFEAPVSGMSMNAARTLGSAAAARDFTALWLYFMAPLAGMLAAGATYRSWRGAHRIFCAKLHHHNDQRCIFRCRFSSLKAI